MAGTLKVGGKVLATHNSETDEISLDSATNASNMSFDANHAGIKTALNASGDAPIYACRAWVNFDGTLDENQSSLSTGENVYIRDAGNVSSVEFNGTGDYTVNFATAMPDENYATIVATSRKSPENESFPNTLGVSRSQSTTSTGIYVRNPYSQNIENVSDCFVTIFR